MNLFNLNLDDVQLASILTPRFSVISSASKILSHSALARFSSGDFFDPLKGDGDDRGLSFRFGGMKIFHVDFQERPKVGARRNLFHSAVMLVPVPYQKKLNKLKFCPESFGTMSVKILINRR